MISSVERRGDHTAARPLFALPSAASLGLITATINQTKLVKIRHFLLLLAILPLACSSAHAQFGGRGFGAAAGPGLSGAMTRFFGEHTAFSASLNMGTKSEQGGTMLMPGKIAYLDGQSRFDIDLSKIEGGKMPAGAADQMKAMGMADMVMISRPDRKITYLIYPGMQSYAENPLREDASAEAAKKFKVEITKIGEETIAGHACVKNRVVVTDDQGKTHEATTWNAISLKDFPVVIETTQKGTAVTLLFSDVKLGKPAATAFEPPKDFKKYDDMQTMLREVLMKRLGGGAPGK